MISPTGSCCLLNEASLISQNISISHHDRDFSTSTYILSTSSGTKGREEPCLGKGEITKQKKTHTHTHTLKHSVVLRSDQKSLQVTAKSRKVTLGRCAIFLEPMPKGPLNATRRTFLCITNLYRKQNSHQPAPETFHQRRRGPAHHSAMWPPQLLETNMATEVHSTLIKAHSGLLFSFYLITRMGGWGGRSSPWKLILSTF